MFYHKDNFKEIVPPDLASLVAKVANDIIDAQGVVLYGRHFNNDKGIGFSTGKESTDTHVCIGIGMSEMATFAPDSVPIKQDKVTAEDEIKALTQRATNAEAEARQLRETRGTL